VSGDPATIQVFCISLVCYLDVAQDPPGQKAEQLKVQAHPVRLELFPELVRLGDELAVFQFVQLFFRVLVLPEQIFFRGKMNLRIIEQVDYGVLNHVSRPAFPDRFVEFLHQLYQFMVLFVDLADADAHVAAPFNDCHVVILL
jgi:hypothetical protein